VNEQAPLPRAVAARAVVRCVVGSGVLLVTGRCHLTRRHVGWRLVFGDGTSAPVYRETVVDRTPADGCVLVVSFRLRLVQGWGHRLFRWESILNTPLFVGFPGFVSKLWLAHDELGNYRGVYQWDGLVQAEHYARCLWRVLAIVSVRGSIRYRVLPELTLAGLLAEQPLSDAPEWWRPVASIEGTLDPPPVDLPSVP
jgi:hypothetical protein